MDEYKAQYYEDALQHYGIRGMQWGHRKKRKNKQEVASRLANNQNKYVADRVANAAKKAGKVGLATASKINSAKKGIQKDLKKKRTNR